MEPWHMVVLLGFVVIVYTRIYLKTPQQQANRNLTEAMEETFDNFAYELEEENKRMIQHIVDMKQQHDAQVSKLTNRVKVLEKLVERLSQQPTSAGVRPHGNPAAVASGTPVHPHGGPSVVASGTPVHSHGDPSAVASGMPLHPPEDSSAMTSTASHPELTIDDSIKSRYRELFEYDQQGKSIDWISRKTGIPKGEVQLIMELARQEERSRA